ncbi:hypothetical protein JCM8115_003207 [Rhodotorula mucilaginosa]|uniref:alkaline phosphatase n=1 Tax=Rhodotorula mucilaginosa TaxID=5537 RepID=A0A9P6W161_RHOMI|nr:hypothetical protein C6P46_004379 [Rhodotorula mucilaginosa]TKA56200.1 hypothetical protein B0A53_01490 [Rhodotorula sp. CCFEE 5036]
MAPRSRKATAARRAVLAAALLATTASAQTFRRTAACPTLGCIFPPSESSFIAGQVFDIRLEAQAPANGSMPFNNGVVVGEPELWIGCKNKELQKITDFFKMDDVKSDAYNFTYYEDLFAEDAKTPTLVNVKAKSYRHVALYEPGEWKAVLKYNGGSQTVARWTVLPLSKKRLAKNAILFVGDGMAPAMVTAARLLGHKTVNGQYQTKLMLDSPDSFGMQMTHSLDSFITDSANSATALMAGHKSTVNALNSYTDSTGSAFGNAKFETVFEMARRIYNSKIGIVSTAYLADATPAAVVTHTSQRSQYAYIIRQFLNGLTSEFPWTRWDGPDVLFGGGGSDFIPNSKNNKTSFIDGFVDKGYQFTTTNASLEQLDDNKRALGLFAASNLPTWLDRHVFTDNLKTFGAWNATAKNFTGPVVDTPGLKEMTIKAVNILQKRSQADNTNFLLMSEAASIDKAMHIGDYQRALADLLELDDTVKATIAHLEELGIRDETLVVVTADHGHGFDVFGSADVDYLRAQSSNDKKRDAVGTYVNSGLSAYQVPAGTNPQNQTAFSSPWGEGFPVEWTPRYQIAAGFAAMVDQYEDYHTRNSSREQTVLNTTTRRYLGNIEDAPKGFFISGNLPTTSEQGVHSLVDVGVYSWGPGSELFAGMQDSTNIAQKIAHALALGCDKNKTMSVTHRAIDF